jgi:hypothetical protein
MTKELLPLQLGRFYFTDDNWPGIIYRGTNADWTDLLNQGGSPRLWTGQDDIEVNTPANVQVRNPETGNTEIETWDVRDYRIYDDPSMPY